MYLRELSLRNIRCFADLHLTFPEPRDDGNWCVILGENGTGKSTILRAVALALANERAANRLLNNPAGWVRTNAARAVCKADFGGWSTEPGEYGVTYAVTQDDSLGTTGVGESSLDFAYRGVDARRGEWLYNIFAGYGPFRRPEAGDSHWRRAPRREEAFRTLFDDSAGIQALEDWLQGMDYAAKDTETGTPEARDALRDRLERIKAVINSLWPEDGKVSLEVNAAGVFFVGAAEEEVPLREMSDGYRAIFALACDLLRLAAKMPAFRIVRRKDGRAIVPVRGIVLIDEVDAHLHPKWQREIGFYLQRTFPRIQFIVATHSPFVAQAATPGGIIVLDRDPKTGDVRADTSLPSLRGVPAEDILQSRAFDLEMTRDIITEAKLQRHAALAAKQLKGFLTENQAKELARLEAELQGLLKDEEDNDEVMQRLEELLKEARGKHD